VAREVRVERCHFTDMASLLKYNEGRIVVVERSACFLDDVEHFRKQALELGLSERNLPALEPNPHLAQDVRKFWRLLLSLSCPPTKDRHRLLHEQVDSLRNISVGSNPFPKLLRTCMKGIVLIEMPNEHVGI